VTLVPAIETLTLEMDDVRFELGRHWRGMDVGRHGGFTMDLLYVLGPAFDFAYPFSHFSSCARRMSGGRALSSQTVLP
jgi:hypothetical protein